MRKLLYILLLVFIIVISGCTQLTPPKRTEKKVTYDNLYVNISGGGLKISKGSLFSVFVTIKNIGDVPITLKKISLLGDILQLEGNLTKQGLNKKIPPGSVYVDTFNLELSLPFGEKTLELYPALCYGSYSEGRYSFYVTTDDEFFVKHSSDPLETSATRSPLRIIFYGNPVYKLIQDDNGNYVSNVYFRVSIVGKNPNSWPVGSCNDISNQKVREVKIIIKHDKNVGLENITTIATKDFQLEFATCLKEYKDKIPQDCLNEFLECIDVKDINNLTNLEDVIQKIDTEITIKQRSLPTQTTQINPEEWYISFILNMNKRIIECLNEIDCIGNLLGDCLSETEAFSLTKWEYLRYINVKQSLKEIPFSFKVVSKNPILSSEIVVIVKAYYDFYETRPEVKTTFEII